MNWMPVKTLVKHGLHWIRKNASTLLTVCAGGGVVTTTVLAIKATPRAEKSIAAKKQELGKEKLTPAETVKACWKDYIYTGGAMAGTIGCIIGATCVLRADHKAAIAGLSSVMERAVMAKEKEIANLKEEMVKNLGEEKAEEIQKKIDEKTPKPASSRDSKSLITYRFDNQFFDATPAKILMIENTILRRLYEGMEVYISLNEILYEMDLEPDPINGDNMFITYEDGFRIMKGPEEYTKMGMPFTPLWLEVMPHAR